MRWLLLIFAAMLVPISAIAQIGLSEYGIMSKNFKGKPCQRVRKILKASGQPAIAVLWQSFGHRPGCLKRFWSETSAAGRTHITEIHLTNEVARRHGDKISPNFRRGLSTQEYNQALKNPSLKLQNDIITRVKKILSLIAPYEYTGQWILSTGLEDQLSKKAWSNLYESIRIIWPHRVARSAINNFPPFHPSGVREYHGYKAHPNDANCILNGDGHDLVGALGGGGLSGNGNEPATMQDVKKWGIRGAKKGCILLLWSAKHQGFTGGPIAPNTLDRIFVVDSKDVSMMKMLIDKLEAIYVQVNQNIS